MDYIPPSRGAETVPGDSLIHIPPKHEKVRAT